MSKRKSNPIPAPKQASSTESVKTKTGLPAWSFHALAVLGLLLLSCLYFYPQLQGMRVMQNDILQWEGMAQEALKYQEETGELTLWTNSMFGGMPTYQINNFQPANKIQYIQKLAQLFFSDPIGLFVAAALWMYLLLVLAGVPAGISFMGAFAFSFTTYHVILYEAGHYLKLQAIGTFPPILAGLYLLFQRKIYTGAALFSLGMGLAIYANHIQMTYYLGIVLFAYFLIELFRWISEKNFREAIIGSLLLLVGLGLAVSSGASKLWTSYEYSKDTMRGEPILAQGGNPGSSSETDGLSWEYAMQWSQGPLELFTILVPGIVGGSSAEKIGQKSKLRSDLKARGVNLPADFKAPLYWGSLPFTSGPVYFGALILFLFLLGMILEKGSLKWWLLGGVLFTLLYSMGKNFSGINQLIFDYLPLMNKFRSPNSITAVTPILMIFLGALTLKHIFEKKYTMQQLKKAIYWSGGSLLGLSLLFAILGPSIFDFAGPDDARLAQSGFPMDAVLADRKSLLTGDAWRSGLIIAIGAQVLWMFARGKMGHSVLLLVLTGITIADLWLVNRRYLDSSDFVTQREYDAYYSPRPADEQILSDKDPNFRVMDLASNTFNSSFASYFHKSIGGYHAAKLQRYQDIIDRHISRNNMQVLNMLNTKYFIVQGDGEGAPALSRLNPEALGNGWLVQDLKIVSTPDAEIDALGEGFDPATTAIVHQEFEEKLQSKTFSGEGSLSLTSYKPNELSYKASATEGQFAVFSEIWYGPDKGWQAYLDGQPAEHIRVNYILRGMELPAGDHEIVFRFEPKSHAIGEKVSLVGSVLIVLAIFLIILISTGIVKLSTKLKFQ